MSADQPWMEIAKVVVRVNMLRDYPLADDMIALWAQTIVRMRAWVTPRHLAAVIDRFILGELEWDRNEGIQNLFRGIHSTRRPDEQTAQPRR